MFKFVDIGRSRWSFVGHGSSCPVVCCYIILFFWESMRYSSAISLWFLVEEVLNSSTLHLQQISVRHLSYH
jgi:hypothetical protein